MMKARVLRDWIKLYESKTKDRADLPAGYRLFYLAERGFASMKPDIKGKMMLVYQVCGDIKFWHDFAELRASEAGLDKLCTICTRHIKPYIRNFGWEILTEQCVNGQYRFFCQDEMGRKVIITHKGLDDNTHEPVYWVTHYLTEKATASPVLALKKKGEVIEADEEGEIKCG